MPKNKGKGGKNRRRGKNENDALKREIIFKEDGQEYAQVLKMLGNGRLQAHCFDGQERLCHIRGKLRKKVPTLPFQEDGQEYAQVLKMLGNGRLQAHCFDGQERLCHIRGKLRKKVWINVGDIVLIGLRDYQNEKADVILKYNSDEARNLKSYGELPETAQINEKAADEEDMGVEFGTVEEEEELAELAAQPGSKNYVEDLITSSEESSSDEDDEEEKAK